MDASYPRSTGERAPRQSRPHLKQGAAILGLALALVGLYWYWPTRPQPRIPARSSACANNLRQISKALAQYCAEKGAYPPACTRDANGRPMHSWRVLVLPYLERPDLYKRYRFEEPWDSPHNRDVTAKVPPVFRCPNDTQPEESGTNYLMVAGRRQMRAPDRDSSGNASFPKGTGETILVVETTSARVHWADPRDLDFAQMSFKINDPQRKGISSRHRGGAMVALLDGSVRYLKDSTDPAALKAMLALPKKKP